MLCKKVCTFVEEFCRCLQFYAGIPRRSTSVSWSTSRCGAMALKRSGQYKSAGLRVKKTSGSLSWFTMSISSPPLCHQYTRVPLSLLAENVICFASIRVARITSFSCSADLSRRAPFLNTQKSPLAYGSPSLDRIQCKIAEPWMIGESSIFMVHEMLEVPYRTNFVSSSWR